MPGLTAWVGLLKIAMLKPGDVVFVSAAAGAVGSVVCQIAKLKGHTVVGSAGGAAKCAFLKHIGVDHIIDYKVVGDLTEALLRIAPTGIDVYFENVGGEHLEAALAAANPFARFAICGMISQYNATELPKGPRNIMPAYAKSLLPWSVVSRPLEGEAPTIDLAVGYSKANTSPILRLFLSRLDELVESTRSPDAPPTTGQRGHRSEATNPSEAPGEWGRKVHPR